MEDDMFSGVVKLLIFHLINPDLDAPPANGFLSKFCVPQPNAQSLRSPAVDPFSSIGDPPIASTTRLISSGSPLPLPSTAIVTRSNTFLPLAPTTDLLASASTQASFSMNSSGSRASSFPTSSSASTSSLSHISSLPLATATSNTSQVRDLNRLPMSSSTSDTDGPSVSTGPPTARPPTITNAPAQPPNEESTPISRLPPSSSSPKSSSPSSSVNSSRSVSRSSSSTSLSTVTSVTPRPPVVSSIHPSRRPPPITTSDIDVAPSSPSLSPPPNLLITDVDDPVTVVRPSGESQTSTLIFEPETTLSTVSIMTLTAGDGSEFETTPSFVTVVHTSTESDGDLVVVTQIAANPQPKDESIAQTAGILSNKGAAAGIFITVGVVSAIVSFLLFMVWRRQRRTEKRRRWFAGMHRQHSSSPGGAYPFDGGHGSGISGGRVGSNASGKSSPHGGMRIEKTVEDDRGITPGFLPWSSGNEKRYPPQQHYRPHSTLVGNNMVPMPMPALGDSVSTLGLTGIGSAMYDNSGTSTFRANGIPSPFRKPVSPHLYDEELRELDSILMKNDSNKMSPQQFTRSNSIPKHPEDAVRGRFGLAPINEGGRGAGCNQGQFQTSPPPSSFNFASRLAPSPAPSSPSLYPPTLADDEAYGGYADGLDDDNSNLFYQRPALASPPIDPPVPPRPPRSRLRDSANSMFGAGNGGKAANAIRQASIGSLGELSPKQNGGARPKIGVNITDLFARPNNANANGKPKEFILLTPPSSVGPASPLQEKHQDILTNRKTLLDVRPRSVTSSTSSN